MTGLEKLILDIGTLSYFEIFSISIISNVFIPFPEEVVILAFGYLSGTGQADILKLIPVIILGLLLSDIGMYILSRKGNKLVNAFYKKVFADKIEERLDWIKNNINKVVFFSRFMVQLRFLGPFMAGQVKMPFLKFLKMDILALLVYVPLFLILGNYFHSRISSIISGVNVLRNAILIFFGLMILIAVFKILRKKVILFLNKNF